METNSVRFVWFSDTHLGDMTGQTRGEESVTVHGTLQSIVTRVQQNVLTPDLVLHTGDVAGGDEVPGEAAYRLANEVLGEFGVPVYAAAGNHDDPRRMNRVLQLGPLSVLGNLSDRLNYHFDPAPWLRVYVLDQRDGFEPQGNLPSETIEALRRDVLTLGPRQYFAVMLHFCPIPGAVPWHNRQMLDRNGLELHRYLEVCGKKCVGVLHGHDHRAGTRSRDGVVYYCAPSTFVQYDATPGAEAPTEIPRGGYAMGQFTRTPDGSVTLDVDYRMFE